MTTTFSALLLVIGTILAFAVHGNPEGFDLNVLGIIMMAFGAIAVPLALGRQVWKDRMYQERVEQGTAPPMPYDGDVLVDPRAPIEGPLRQYPLGWLHDPQTQAWYLLGRRDQLASHPNAVQPPHGYSSLLSLYLRIGRRLGIVVPPPAPPAALATSGAKAPRAIEPGTAGSGDTTEWIDEGGEGGEHHSPAA